MSTESVGKVKTGVSHSRFSALLAAVLAILAMGPASASALSCGTTLYVNTTLTANVGPCSGVALYLSNGLGNQPVLYLNGYKIFCKVNAPGSIGVQLDAFD